MKKLLLLLIIPLFFSCQDSKKSLIGSWHSKELLGKGSFTFYENGSAMLEGKGTYMGSWEIIKESSSLCMEFKEFRDKECYEFEWIDDNSIKINIDGNINILKRQVDKI